eukprot:1797615-Rhodomonas_salina.1
MEGGRNLEGGGEVLRMASIQRRKRKVASRRGHGEHEKQRELYLMHSNPAQAKVWHIGHCLSSLALAYRGFVCSFMIRAEDSGVG